MKIVCSLKFFNSDVFFHDMSDYYTINLFRLTKSTHVQNIFQDIICHNNDYVPRSIFSNVIQNFLNIKMNLVIIF